MTTAYNKDYHAWSQEQAHLLRSHAFQKLDIEHLAEEIETLSNSDKRALESYLTILLVHLLKIEYQAQKRTRSWDLSIKHSKHKVNKILKANPSFRRLLPEFLKEAYFSARLEAAYETGLEEKTFPKKCPWQLEELL